MREDTNSWLCDPLEDDPSSLLSGLYSVGRDTKGSFGPYHAKLGHE